MAILAPVVIFVYSRPWHTCQTVEALKKNYLSDQTDLIIYSDAPKAIMQDAGVSAVRSYIASITGFKSLTIHERDWNLGLAASIIQGITQVLAAYENVIVLEDDMVTSPYFLQYMNDALNRFALDGRVVSVHGYMYPVGQDLPDAFFLPGADCWGWATWARGWKIFNPDGAQLLNELRKRRLVRAFNFNGAYSYSGMLESQICGKNDSWAIRWHASAFLAGKLTLYPGKSLVCNIGNDASGTHSKVTCVFDVKLCDSPVDINNVKVEPSKEALKAVEMYFRSQQPIVRKILAFLFPGFSRHALKAVVKASLPKVLVRGLVRLLTGAIRFKGPYPSWAAASSECSGYDAAGILEKVLESSLKVKNGTALYERDSVIFNKIQYSWPVTASLMWVAARNGGRLHVLDFGGSLGSSYFQNRKYLEGLSDVRWCVVEQGHYVDAGKRHIQDERLSFCDTVDEAVRDVEPNVVLLSSVLQYLSSPYEIIDQLCNQGASVVIVDRTPFLNSSGPSCVKIQSVPRSIYKADYPCWFFEEKVIMDRFADNGYFLIEQFDALDALDRSATWKGMIFRNRSNVQQ